MKHRSVIPTVLLSSVIALALAACSSSGGKASGDSSTQSGGAPSGSSTATSSTATKSALKIWVPVDQTGSSPDASAEQARNVVAAWMASVNASGGIQGHPVDAFVTDNQGSASLAVSNTQAALSKGAIAAVSAGPSSETAWMPLLDKANVPIMGGICYAEGATCGKQSNIFPTAASYGTIIYYEAAAAKAVGAKSYGAIVCAENALCQQIEPLWRNAINSFGGIRWDGLVTAAGSAPDYTAQCLTFKKKNTELIQVGLSGATIGKLITGCAQQDYFPTIGMGGDTVESKTVGVLSKANPKTTIVGGISGFPWWVDDPAAKTFRDIMEKYAPGKSYEADTATVVWNALEILRNALSEATLSDQPTAADVTAALFAMKPTNLNGLLPQMVSYDKSLKVQKNVTCYWYYKTQNSVWTAIPGGLKPSCQP